MVDFTVFLDKLFKCLREFQVITRNDLKDKLGLEDRWRSKILTRAIRKLETIGCVRRVRAISQYASITKSRYPAVILVREPNANDLKLFHNESRSLVTFLGHEDNDNMEADDAQEPEDGIQKPTESVPRLGVDAAKDVYLEDIGRVIPQWTPDRNLPNIIFSIVDQAGPKGISNLVSESFICPGWTFT